MVSGPLISFIFCIKGLIIERERRNEGGNNECQTQTKRAAAENNARFKSV
jgi:hypothetical protein